MIGDMIFRAGYFDNHKELKDGYYEFNACDWRSALVEAAKKRYMNDTDGLKSLEIVGKIIPQEVRF